MTFKIQLATGRTIRNRGRCACRCIHVHTCMHMPRRTLVIGYIGSMSSDVGLKRIQRRRDCCR